MKLIVGLGNPGSEYRNSRHNVGFCLVDLLSQRWSVELKRRKHEGRFGSGFRGSEQVLLLKPQTYMNLSGASVLSATSFYKIEDCDLLVVVDDMALELGRVRLRSGGSSGGHNGLKDIVGRLGHDAFARLRIGIGAAAHNDAVGHVLGRFDESEQKAVDEAIVRAADAVDCWIDCGVDEAMTRYNAKIE